MIVSPSFVIWICATILVLTIIMIALAIVTYACVSQINEARGRLKRLEQEQLRSNRGYSAIKELATKSKESAEKAADETEKCSKVLAFVYGEMINLRTEVKHWISEPKHMIKKETGKKEQGHEAPQS